jgi:hypothetical protein
MMNSANSRSICLISGRNTSHWNKYPPPLSDEGNHGSSQMIHIQWDQWRYLTWIIASGLLSLPELADPAFNAWVDVDRCFLDRWNFRLEGLDERWIDDPVGS